MGRSIEEVAATYASAWMSIPGVVGVYCGETEWCEAAVIVMTTVPPEELHGVIPVSVEGFPVVFEDDSDLRPMAPPRQPEI